MGRLPPLFFDKLTNTVYYRPLINMLMYCIFECGFAFAEVFEIFSPLCNRHRGVKNLSEPCSSSAL